MAIPAMALLQQHDARRHILIETAARRHAAIEAFRTGGIQNWGRSELGAQSGRKNQPACYYYYYSSPGIHYHVTYYLHNK